MAVIDASVYVALMNEGEDAHARSWAWWVRTVSEGDPIVAPTILLAEVSAALSRGTGNAALARRVVTQLVRSELVDLIAVTRTLGEQAAAIAADYTIRGCDAVYVALAAQAEQCLVTLDRQQLDRAGAMVEVREP
jgi:predicted nucleic acid-binding protein